MTIREKYVFSVKATLCQKNQEDVLFDLVKEMREALVKGDNERVASLFDQFCVASQIGELMDEAVKNKIQGPVTFIDDMEDIEITGEVII